MVVATDLSTEPPDRDRTTQDPRRRRNGRQIGDCGRGGGGASEVGGEDGSMKVSTAPGEVSELGERRRHGGREVAW
ncbi:hypothetical protein TIFTF001_024304 [Ficus carica]|uniref:Uncharacterized protein n=1 Tax=Ficus carica TaxID=3494 RepID=A0AA88AL53_FICCA|nr:hypothetical protein TIFTF001_024304 [Ficus carica]